MLRRAHRQAEPAPGPIDANRVHRGDDPVERVASRVVNDGGLLSNRDVVKALGEGTDQKRPAAAAAIARLGPGHGLGPFLAERAARASITHDAVRLHTGPSAESFTASIGARAATVGNHIALGRGVRPATHEGRRVIDHELVHVAQRIPKIGRNGEEESASLDEPGASGLSQDDVDLLKDEIADEKAEMFREADLGFVREQIDMESDETEVAFWNELAEDPRARALKFRAALILQRAALILQEASISSTDRLYEYLDKAQEYLDNAQTWAESEEETLLRAGLNWQRWAPWAFPDTWADLVEGVLHPPAGLELETAQTVAADARAEMMDVAGRIPGYLWENGLPVPFAAALKLSAYPFLPSLAEGPGSHIVHEFAREAKHYLPAEVTRRLASGWSAGKRSLLYDLRAGRKTIDPASWDEVSADRVFQPDLSRLAADALDRDIDIKASMDADTVDLWRYELALAKLSGYVELLFYLQASVGIAGVFAKALASADELVANASVEERLDHADAWASAQGYPSAARTALVASLKANAGQIAIDVAKDVAISMIPFIGWGWRIKEAIEEAADWYQAGESLVDARERASAATSVVALQRAAAQISSAEMGIAAQVALTAASKGAEVAVSTAVKAVKGSAGEAVEADLTATHGGAGPETAASAPSGAVPQSAAVSTPTTAAAPGTSPELAAEVQRAIKEVEKELGGTGAPPAPLPPGSPLGPEDIDAALSRGFQAEGPLVSAPIDSPVLDIGTGPSPANLGIGDKSVVQIIRTDVVTSFPIDRVLNAEGALADDLVGSAQAIIINNPYSYTPNLAELARAVRPGGKIIIQGHRKANKYFRALIKKGPPKGFVTSVDEGFDAAVDLSPAAKADPDVMAETIRRNILGGPFRYTKGGESGPRPNVRVVYEKPIEGAEALGKRLGAESKGKGSRFDYVAGGINSLQLGQRNAAQAATSATEEMGLRLWRTQVGDDIVLAEVAPGRNKAILIVKPDGTVHRGTADIAVRTPVTAENPLELSNITEKPPILPGR